MARGFQLQGDSGHYLTFNSQTSAWGLGAVGDPLYLFNLFSPRSTSSDRFLLGPLADLWSSMQSVEHEFELIPGQDCYSDEIVFEQDACSDNVTDCMQTCRGLNCTAFVISGRDGTADFKPPTLTESKCRDQATKSLTCGMYGWPCPALCIRNYLADPVGPAMTSRLTMTSEDPSHGVRIRRSQREDGSIVFVVHDVSDRCLATAEQPLRLQWGPPPCDTALEAGAARA